MKKLTGIIGVTVVAIAIFFNTSSAEISNNNYDLASIIKMDTANAECGAAPPCSRVCYQNVMFYCYLTCELQYVYCENRVPRSS